jgi:hypothetical protein
MLPELVRDDGGHGGEWRTTPLGIAVLTANGALAGQSLQVCQ